MAFANKSPTLATYLAPLAGSLWIFFLILSVIVAPVWALDLGEAQIRGTIRVKELQAALLWLSGIADIAWLTVAAIITYSSIARSVGLATARRWALLVLGISWLAGALSAWSGWPLGPVYFTGRLGFLIGPVSVGWLILWCVVILGSRDLILSMLPRASHAQVALLTGVLAGLTDLNLESLASKTRAWWLWIKAPASGLPQMIQAPLMWFLIALLLVSSFDEATTTTSLHGSQKALRYS